MSKTNDPIVRAFLAAEEAGDLPAAVALARQVFLRQLYDRSGGMVEEPGSLVEALRGELGGGATKGHLCDLFAAYVIGIAAGQLLHADCFAKH